MKFFNHEFSKFSHEERDEGRILYLKSMYKDESDANRCAPQRFDNLVTFHYSDLFEDGDPNFGVCARQFIAKK